MYRTSSDVSRRQFLVGGFSAGLLAITSPIASAQVMTSKSAKAKVVVVGGGYGGVTLAKYLKKENPELSVTLIEERPFFMSCPMSNHYLAGLMELTSLCFSYNVLPLKYNVKFVNDRVVNVDLSKREVITTETRIKYDFLVLSPGIDYDVDSVPGYKESLVHNPPAFKPGSEHIYLKKLLDEFEGGDIVMTVPEPPYRCPPAPYERAALIASMIKRLGLKAHIYFIDANDRPIINSQGFLSAYYDMYKDVATYVTSTQVKEVDVNKKVVRTTNGDFRYDIANIVPPMKANSLLEKIGLLKKGEKWAQVDPLTFESRVENVFVIGDAAQTYLPKSGYAAHSQAKALAKVINSRITGKPVEREYLQMICYAMVSDKEAIMTETSFTYDAKTKRFIPKHLEDNVRKATTAKRYEEWARGLWRDLFG